MLLPPLLDSGVRILFYQGDLDFIVNHQGITVRRAGHPSPLSGASWQRCSSGRKVRSCKTPHLVLPIRPCALLTAHLPSPSPP